MLPTPVAVPKGQVDLNGNRIDSKLTGGYSGYQLWPRGHKMSPIRQLTEKPLNIANMDSIFCYKEDDKFDLYLCTAKTQFKEGETVELIGNNCRGLTLNTEVSR